jgi:hypothetical protein
VVHPGASIEQLEALKKSLFQDLIIPAFKLSEKFHLSPKLFSLSCRGLHGDREKIAGELEMYDCRSVLENGKAVRMVQDGFNYQYVIDIYPALYSRTIKNHSFSPPKLLKKGQVLVAVTKQDTVYNLKGETAISLIYNAVQEHKRRTRRG